MQKIEHIGIAVENLEDANALFTKLLGTAHYKVEKVEGEKVATSFFQIGDTKIELLEATAETSAIHKFIQKRGKGVHHIAFGVENIYEEMERLKGEGFELLNEVPKEGADNKLVCFLHPKTTGGVLVEICQEKKNG